MCVYQNELMLKRYCLHIRRVLIALIDIRRGKKIFPIRHAREKKEEREKNRTEAGSRSRPHLQLIAYIYIYSYVSRTTHTHRDAIGHQLVPSVRHRMVPWTRSRGLWSRRRHFHLLIYEKITSLYARLGIHLKSARTRSRKARCCWNLHTPRNSLIYMRERNLRESLTMTVKSFRGSVNFISIKPESDRHSIFALFWRAVISSSSWILRIRILLLRNDILDRDESGGKKINKYYRTTKDLYINERSY